MGVAGPDGSIIIGLRNGSLRELNRQTGQLGDPWDAHTSPVTRIVPWQSNSLITLSADGHLILWNHDRRERLAELAPPAPALDICSISDADIVIAHADHSLRIWTLRPSEAGSNLPFVWSETNKIAELSQAIVDLDYSVSTRRLGVGATDGSMAVYDLSQNAVMRQWNQGSPVRRISITADGNRVAAVGDDGKPRIWDIASSNLVAELSTNYEVKDVFDRAVFGRDLANRHVENAKQDLEQEKQRLQQETDNHKKTQENLMKAEEEAKKKTDAVNAAAAEVMKDEVSLASLKGQLSASETVLAENRRKRSEAEAAYDALFVRIAEHQTLYAQTKEELQQASQALMDAQTRAEQAKDNTELAQQVTACQEKVRLATEKRTAQDAARRASLKTLIDQSQVLEQANSAEQESQAMVAKATEAIAPVEKTLAEKRSAADKSTNELADAKRALESATASVEQARVAIEQSELRVKESQDNVTQCEVKQQHAEQYRAEAEKRQAESPLRIVDSVFSTDGLWLTLIAENGAISTWTASQGQLVITNGLINDGHAAMVPVDHHGLYIMSAEGSIRMVKIVPTWSLIHTIGSADGESPFSDRVTAVCFSPDSTELAVGGGSPSRSGELKIFSVVDATEKRDLANIHSDVVYGLAYSPDGRFLASCGADRFMKVTDIASGEIHRTFEGHTHHVLSVDWQADGRVLATTGADKVVKLWNFREGSQIRTIQGFGKEVTSVRYYGPNDVFFVVSGDKSIYQCNLNGNRNSVGVGDDFLYSVSASQIGDTIAYGGHDSVVRIIDGSGKHRVQMKPAN
jgi:WD40 repeat protein